MHGNIDNIIEAVNILAKKIEELSSVEQNTLSADIDWITHHNDEFADTIIKRYKS